MDNVFAYILLLIMLSVVFIGFQGEVNRPKSKFRSTDRIIYRNRWYPILLAGYASIGIIHNLTRLVSGKRGVYIVGFAIYVVMLVALFMKRGFLRLIVDTLLIIIFLSAIVRFARFIQGNGSAATLREISVSLLLAGLAYLGKNAYVAYRDPPTTEGNT